MKTLGLVASIFGLLALRQPLLIILLAAAACVHMFWGRGNLEDIIEDMWVGLDKEVILSIPLFILCGSVMTRGSIAQRLEIGVALRLGRRLCHGFHQRRRQACSRMKTKRSRNTCRSFAAKAVRTIKVAIAAAPAVTPASSICTIATEASFVFGP